MNVIKKENYKVPVFSWCPEIEESAMAQIDNLAQLPFVFNRVSIMSDCHAGYGMPIGGVLATKGVIIPNAVGVDIGCGMCAVKTSLTEINTETLKTIMTTIRETIPVGFNRHKKEQDITLMPNSFGFPKIVEQEFDKAKYQIGTLGGGNHFIEIQKGDDGHIWIMIHSGSRNLGFTVAKHYNDLAITLNQKWHTIIPKKWELAFLPLDSEEGQNYITEMNYCVKFALANRKLMMDRVKMAFAQEIEDTHGGQSGIEFEEMINIAHNYAELEHHFGENVMVHRKGATLAREGTIGIIPGSQGTKSYIVKGKGNKQSFESCSHGAGRKMGRKEAQRTLNLDEEIKALNEQGVVHAKNKRRSRRSTWKLQRHPNSYGQPKRLSKYTSRTNSISCNKRLIKLLTNHMFKIGDKVWFIDKNNSTIFQKTIVRIEKRLNEETIYGLGEGGEDGNWFNWKVTKDELYTTKEELKEKQAKIVEQLIRKKIEIADEDTERCNRNILAERQRIIQIQETKTEAQDNLRQIISED